MAESENMRLDARRDGTRLLVSLPKGDYVFCDPCCPVTSELWARFWKKTIPIMESGEQKGGYAFPENGGKTGLLVFMYNKLGDGRYPGMDNAGNSIEFGADTGSLGVVSMDIAASRPEWPPKAGYCFFAGPAMLGINRHGFIFVEKAGEKVVSVRPYVREDPDCDEE